MQHQHSSVQLILRSVEPSLVSTVLSLFAGIAIASAHLFSASIRYGTIAPGVLGGQFGILYTNSVVGPMTSIINSRIYGNLLLALFWSGIGLLAYELCALLGNSWRSWHESKHEVSFGVNQRHLQHKLQQTLLLRLVWRLGLGLLVVYIAYLIRPLISFALQADSIIVQGRITGLAAIHEVLAALVWAGVLTITCYICPIICFSNPLTKRRKLVLKSL